MSQLRRIDIVPPGLQKMRLLQGKIGQRTKAREDGKGIKEKKR
jgi:hypothetical protein